jgi:hypothetical protein
MLTKPLLGASDAALLRVLQDVYGDAHFDETNVSIDALRFPELLAALGFLSPKINRRRRSLTDQSNRSVAKWLDRTQGWLVGRLALARDSRGWSYVAGLTGVGP